MVIKDKVAYSQGVGYWLIPSALWLNGSMHMMNTRISSRHEVLFNIECLGLSR